MESVPVITQSTIPMYALFHISAYEDLHNIVWKVPRDLLTEVLYIICHYTETKPILDPILVRPVPVPVSLLLDINNPHI
jgi:hypothetical protein